MTIGILSPLNPFVLSDLLSSNNIIKPINPTSTSVNNIVRALVERKQNVIVFTIDYSSNTNYSLFGESLSIYVLGARCNNVLSRKFPNIHRIADLLSKQVNPFIKSIDIIHAHWCYEYAIAASAYSKYIPTFCTIRDWAPIIYKSIEINGNIVHLLEKIYWIYKRKIASLVLSNENIHFVANSEYTQSLFLERFTGRSIDRIYNSIEDQYIVPTLPEKCSKKAIFISIAADLDDKRKNIETLVLAFNKFYHHNSNCLLYLIGHYHMNEGIHNIVMNLPIFQSVVFGGTLPRKEILKYIDNSSCLIHPAYEETFGNTLIEAMARGIPVIGGTHSGAVPYVLGFGKYGYLCDVYSVESLFNAMSMVFTQDTRPIAKQALLRIQTSFSSESSYTSHINIYKRELVNKRK